MKNTTIMISKTLLKIVCFTTGVILLSASFSTYALSYIKSAAKAYHHNTSQFQTNLYKARSVESMCRVKVSSKLHNKGYLRPNVHNNMHSEEVTLLNDYLQKSNGLQDECNVKNGYDAYMQEHKYYLDESRKFKSRFGKLTAKIL